MKRIIVRDGARALALAIAGIAIHLHGCTVDSKLAAAQAVEPITAEDRAEMGPQVPPGLQPREQWMCDTARTRITVLGDNRMRMEGSCFEMDTYGRFRTVPGDCDWIRSFEGHCPEVKQ